MSTPANDPRYTMICCPRVAALCGARRVKLTDGKPVMLDPMRPTLLFIVPTADGGDYEWWFMDIHPKVVAEVTGGG